MRCIDIRVVVNHPLATVFATYTQPDTFSWCSYMRRVRWVRGRPWERESRLQIQTDDPIGGKIDQVLLHFEPNRRVDFISHFAAITLQSRVHFQSVSEGETEIRAQMEFIGTFSAIAALAVEATIEKRTRQLFEDLARACDAVPVPTLRAGDRSSLP